MRGRGKVHPFGLRLMRPYSEATRSDGRTATTRWDINGHTFRAREVGGLWDVWDEDGSWRMEGVATLKRVCLELLRHLRELPPPG